MKFLVTLALAILAEVSFSASERVVCYYGSWSIYRYNKAKFEVEHIDPSLCTHLIYSFAGLDDNGEVKLLDAWNDVGDEWHEGVINKKIPRLLENYPDTKFSVAIGGWNEGSEKYSRVMNNDALRATFIKSVLNFVRTYNLDGFDLDWEYPTQRGGQPSDRAAFAKLVEELGSVLRANGYFLSAAVSANALVIPEAYDVPKISQHLDFINVMTYDLHGSWEKVTNHHTALFAHSSDPVDERHLNVDAAIKSWLANGADPKKLTLGVGSYGRSFTLSDPNNHGIGAPASGPGEQGTYVGESGFLGYNEICYGITQNVWSLYYSPSQEVPYAVNGKKWVGYDDPASITKKVEYAKRLGLGGVMIWSIETDDFRGDCNQGKYPLLRAINAALNSNGNTVTPPPQTEAPATDAPATDAPATDAPATDAPATDAPATDAPGNDDGTVDSQCKQNGEIIRSKTDCSVYYVCTFADGTGQTYKAVEMKCAPGLAFDTVTKNCDYRSRLAC